MLSISISFSDRNSDRGDSIFNGPIKDDELLGFLCGAKFAIDLQESALDLDRLFEIMDSKYEGLETVQANLKKTDDSVKSL